RLPRAGEDSAAAGSATGLGSTKATGASARDRDTSSDPACPGACCDDARRPWPCWLGCLRAAEPAALATAVTPSFAGRRPAKPRTTSDDCPTWQATQTPLLQSVSGQWTLLHAPRCRDRPGVPANAAVHLRRVWTDTRDPP